jgi:predicted transcriptional regulator
MQTAVQILAEGVCLRTELQYRLGINGGSIQRLLDALVEENLVEQIFFGSGQTKYAVLRLTDKGIIFAFELGCAVRKSEWDILAAHHNAEVHRQHAFAVLLFAFQARRRAWKVQVCPKVDSPLVEPDVLVEKDGERVYVEVEVLRNPRKRRDGADNTWVRKWYNQYHFQGRVAVCTLTPKRMQGIVRYLKPRWRGMATELTTLAKNPYSDLWLERWEWPNEASRQRFV